MGPVWNGPLDEAHTFSFISLTQLVHLSEAGPRLEALLGQTPGLAVEEVNSSNNLHSIGSQEEPGESCRERCCHVS